MRTLLVNFSQAFFAFALARRGGAAYDENLSKKKAVAEGGLGQSQAGARLLPCGEASQGSL